MRYLADEEKSTNMSEVNTTGIITLKADTIENLRMLKLAFEICYNKAFTDDEFIMQMAASVEEGDVAVWEMFCDIKNHPIDR